MFFDDDDDMSHTGVVENEHVTSNHSSLYQPRYHPRSGSTRSNLPEAIWSSQPWKVSSQRLEAGELSARKNCRKSWRSSALEMMHIGWRTLPSVRYRGRFVKNSNCIFFFKYLLYYRVKHTSLKCCNWCTIP